MQDLCVQKKVQIATDALCRWYAPVAIVYSIGRNYNRSGFRRAASLVGGISIVCAVEERLASRMCLRVGDTVCRHVTTRWTEVTFGWWRLPDGRSPRSLRPLAAGSEDAAR